MELITIDVPIDDPNEEYIIATITDTHVGARDFDRTGFKKYVNWIAKTKNVISIVLGDVGEHISTSDQRWDARTIDQEYKPENLACVVQHETQDFKNLIKPIENKISVLCTGNHDLKSGTRGEYCPHIELLKSMGSLKNSTGSAQFIKLDKNLNRATPPADGSYEGFIRLRFIHGRKLVNCIKIYYHHGAKGGSASSITGYLDKLMADYNADLIMVGHGHRIAVHERVRAEPSNKWFEILIKPSIAVMHGSWKRGWGSGYTTYESKTGYSPKTLGPVPIRIIPADKTIKASLGDRPWEKM